MGLSAHPTAGSIDTPATAAAGAPLASEHYRSLADFRRYLRRFLAFSDEITSTLGLHPSQYQALLAIRALGDEGVVTTSALARQLSLKLNSVVELVDRLIAAGFVARARAARDRRVTELCLTPAGERTLEPLAAAHLAHHRAHLSELIASITPLIE